MSAGLEYKAVLAWGPSSANLDANGRGSKWSGGRPIDASWVGNLQRWLHGLVDPDGGPRWRLLKALQHMTRPLGACAICRW